MWVFHLEVKLFINPECNGQEESHSKSEKERPNNAENLSVIH